MESHYAHYCPIKNLIIRNDESRKVPINESIIFKYI